MPRFLPQLVAALLLLTASRHLPAQALPEATRKRIDNLFKQWDSATSPGFTIGIVRHDSLLYAKGYGMANLEYGIPNTPETVYHLASVSKQFTAYCVLRLAHEGKLRLDDDVRKYLPWFPSLGPTITIRHLLHHTSGIRDQWDLLLLGGTRLDDVITQEHIVKLLGKQQALNFAPGEQFVYCNSGFTMLSEIVKKVSGKPLRSYADSILFRPLGMTHTLVHDDHREVVPNRAYSYRTVGKAKYQNAVLSYANSGATSLFSNVPDLARWVMNFCLPRAGDQPVLAELTRPGVLTNGKQLPYAAGIGVEDYRGWKQYSHGGADAGYRTFVTVFPEAKMGVIVLCNVAEGNPAAQAAEIANLFLKDKSAPKPQASQPLADSSMTRLADAAALQSFTGDYYSADGAIFGYSLKNGKFYWKSAVAEYLLADMGHNTFSTLSSTRSRFVFTQADGTVKITQTWPTGERTLRKINPLPPDAASQLKALEGYAGVYYSPELDYRYTLAVQGQKLVLSNDRSADVTLRYLDKDVFFGDGVFVNLVRDKRQRVTGLEVNTGRVKRLAFQKL